MMRLAEDGAMFTIARFEKRFSYLQGHSEILRTLAGEQGFPILIQRHPPVRSFSEITVVAEAAQS
jgi:hypothetical protein